MESDVWAFGCQLGLAQGTCGEYVPDEKARGYGRWGGCPSCEHRVPRNGARSAESTWATRGAVKPPPEEHAA